MKKILIYIIRGYQIIPFSSHKFCRCIPTCSEYTIQAINTYGCLKGLTMGFKRIIKCRPHGIYGYDPLPPKNSLNNN